MSRLHGEVTSLNCTMSWMVGWRGEISLPLSSQIICFVPVFWVNLPAREVTPHTWLRPYSENKVVAVRGKLFCLVQQKISHLQALSFPQLHKPAWSMHSTATKKQACFVLQEWSPDRTVQLGACMFPCLLWQRGCWASSGLSLGPSRKQYLKGVDGHWNARAIKLITHHCFPYMRSS